ncbi:ATP-dependent DNA helicase [Halorarius halobius]|uniref:ATP-dependent DNA helicase n=1 Tax=Halorarius halobius TaxID=2962671 RepID=UPI0033137DA0
MSETASFLRYFPYEAPYDHQHEAMDRIHDALGEGRDVLFEGACGTGKTLASLVPALEYADREDKTVVITTNVHQQTRQFIEEARAITRQEPIRTVVFRGKGSMCHIDVGYEECQALRDTTRELVDQEAELADLERRQEELLDAAQDGNEQAAEARSSVMDELETVEEGVEALREEATICDRYYANLTEDTDEFYAWLYEDVRTPDDVYEYAERAGFCGYELLKEGMEGVDLVVCNYHHLLDPTIREQFFRWLGRDPEDVVAVFDEAHNVEDAARDHATRTLTETTLDSALEELDEVEDYRVEAAERVVSAFREALGEVYDEALGFGERETLGDDWADVTVDNDEGRDDLTLAFLDAYEGPGYKQDLEAALNLGSTLDRKYQEQYKEGETTSRKECRVLQAAGFVEEWMDESKAAGTYPVVSVRRDETGVYGRAELYTCIPRQVTEPLFEELYASVLMSATLRPFDVTEDVLGVGADREDGPVTMAFGEQFPPERRRTYAVDAPALFASQRDDPGVQETVTEVLSDAVRMTPGNTLAFFPSYSEAERYYHRLETEATPYLDRPGVRAQELKEEFVDDDDAVLFTSLWGTLTEGVSYDDDDARTVVVVGVPYPHLDDRMEAVQGAYATAFGDDDGEKGWEYAVEVPTVRKTRQALGRVVRSPEDFGARVLVDERYTQSQARELGDYSVYPTFPEEERTEHIDVNPGKLKYAMLNFYADMDAWPEGPPTP